MHIHLPKPLHGWREFAKEVGIIVLGVVIALGGEQAVEAIHHHEQVSDLSRALDQELAHNAAVLRGTIDLRNCVSERLDELERWSEAAARGRPIQLSGEVKSPPSIIFRSAVWRSAGGSAVEYLPLDKRILYARLYDTVDNVDRIRHATVDRWNDLALIIGADGINKRELLRISQDIANIRGSYDSLAANYAILNESLDPSVKSYEAHSAASEVLLSRRYAEFCKPLLAN